jgi:hypothetical protein
VFSFLSYFVAIPSAIKVFNWTATLYKGSISFATPMLYAFGFIGLFTIGGLTGLFLASLGFDVHVTDTYFVVAHFHYIMVGGTIMAYMGGLHYWWPKMTGRMYPEGWAKLSALVVFLGFNLTFFPQFILGYMGMPRRYHVYPEEFSGLARALHRRRFRTGRGLSHADGLFHLVSEIWRHGAGQSLGRLRPRVEDPIAAAAAQFRRDADRHPRSLRLQLSHRGGDPSWLATRTFTLTKKLLRSASSSTPPRSRRTLPLSECGSSSSPK